MVILNSKNTVQNRFASQVLYCVYIRAKQVALPHYQVHVEEIHLFREQEYVIIFSLSLLISPTKNQPPLKKLPDLRDKKDFTGIKRDGFCLGFFFFLFYAEICFILNYQQQLHKHYLHRKTLSQFCASELFYPKRDEQLIFEFK